MASEHAHGHGGVEDDGYHPEHIPVGVYHGIFWALMGLLALTLAAAAVDLGVLNLPIALTIAAAKAALVMTYFMHLRVSTKLIVAFSLAALFWLGIMFTLTFSDYFAREFLISVGYGKP